MVSINPAAKNSQEWQDWIVYRVSGPAGLGNAGRLPERDRNLAGFQELERFS
jgi:hypothetical protein